jgi:hypothetical protein
VEKKHVQLSSSKLIKVLLGKTIDDIEITPKAEWTILGFALFERSLLLASGGEKGRESC